MSPGKAVRAARERAGLGVRELAGIAGLSAATVSAAEAGQDARASTLEILLRHLPSLSVSELLGRAAKPAEGRDALWSFMRMAMGLSVAKLRFEVLVDPVPRSTRVLMTGIRPASGGPLDDATLRRLMHLVFLGSTGARARLAGIRLAPGGEAALDDGGHRHAFRLARQAERHGLTYEREQLADESPPGPAAAALGLGGPLARGVSLAIELPVEELEIAATFAESAGPLPAAARCAAWAVQQPVPRDEPDLLHRLHGGADVATSRSPRLRELSCRVSRPWTALHYGLGWDDGAPAVPADEPSPDRGAAIRAAREAAGLSQRDLARRLNTSPVTIAGAERGRDVRASLLASCLAALPGLAPDSLLRPGPPARLATRPEAWEIQRRAFGLEADEERKTLHVTPEGDAHAVLETLRLRRDHAGGGDLRVRYSSALAGPRLPTVLKAIEDALAEEAEESGLKARVVERREGRLIHEIIVPARLAASGVSFSRRLFDQGFFAPAADATAEAAGHDGAAIVPSHPVRRLLLRVVLPPGRFPSRVIAGVHPRMRLDGPLAEADLAPGLHPEGLGITLSRSERALELSVEHPLVGFIYDVFWERGGAE